MTNQTRHSESDHTKKYTAFRSARFSEQPGIGGIVPDWWAQTHDRPALLIDQDRSAATANAVPQLRRQLADIVRHLAAAPRSSNSASSAQKGALIGGQFRAGYSKTTASGTVILDHTSKTAACQGATIRQSC